MPMQMRSRTFLKTFRIAKEEPETEPEEFNAKAHIEKRKEATSNGLMLDPKKIRPFENQPRKLFNEKKILRIAKSIARIGQRTPVSVKEIEGDPEHTHELVDGENRVLAFLLFGPRLVDFPEKIRAVVEEVADEAEQHTLSIASNFCKNDHYPIEIAWAIRKEAETKTAEEIADIFGYSVSWVNQHKRLNKLCPAVQKMMYDDEVPEEQWLTLSKALIIVDNFPEDHAAQLEIAQRIRAKDIKVGVARNETINYAAGNATIKPNDSGRKGNKPYRRLSHLKTFLQRSAELSKSFGELSESFLADAIGDNQNNVKEKMIKQIQAIKTSLAALETKISQVGNEDDDE